MRFKNLAVFFTLLLASVCSLAQALPVGVQKVTAVEGITEYSFPNGLHVLLFPDSSQPKITVNVVYHVGSRNEAYGETGMAHLLEHMNFKSSASGRELFKDLSNRAAGFFNGTTSYDQTMYFESFSASDENLRWALDLETDRMAHMTMQKKDLDTEMTVVRNEMERGENDPGNVLEERVLASAYNFHNYGKTVIGARSDVERVPIENLAAFYHKYYQPDNATLILAGKFEAEKALDQIAKTLGALPKPTRVLSQPYTVEPTQEGEREVILRRVGDQQLAVAVYHIPSAFHPDLPALKVLAQVLGAPQTGRLYKDLVDTKKAVSVDVDAEAMHDPGFLEADIQLKPDQSLDDAVKTLLKGVEEAAEKAPTQEEVDRAKARIEKNIELALTNSQMIAVRLGNSIGEGDWRLFFLNRDELAKVTPADVERVAKAYLKSSNRTLGEFIPTAAPDRAVIAAAPDDATLFRDFKSGAAIQEGETFDPTPKNIEARLIRTRLPNGMKLVLFPKKTRGGTVFVNLNFRFGDEKSLFGKSTTASLMSGLFMRATQNKNRQQIQDETDRLKAQIQIHASAGHASASVRTLDANLAGSLRFLRELMREADFPESEFEQVRQQGIAGAESQKSEPEALTQNALERHLNAQYPRGDVRYVSTIDEDITDLKAAKPEEVRQYYKEFFAPAEGEIAISGQFDPAQVQKLVTELFGDWKSNKPYARITDRYQKVAAINTKIETPDKQNSLFMAGSAFPMNDENPEFPALRIGGMILGGSTNSRLFLRIRVKDGLSYGAGAEFEVPTKDDAASFTAYAIAAPQNTPKVEADFQEEIARILKDGVTEQELTDAKKAWLEQRLMQRSNEGSLAGILTGLDRWDRTMDWQAKMEAAVSALTVPQVNEALKHSLDPSAITIVKGGDFNKAGAYK